MYLPEQKFMSAKCFQTVYMVINYDFFERHGKHDLFWKDHRIAQIQNKIIQILCRERTNLHTDKN